MSFLPLLRHDLENALEWSLIVPLPAPSVPSVLGSDLPSFKHSFRSQLVRCKLGVVTTMARPFDFLHGMVVWVPSQHFKALFSSAVTDVSA